MEEEGETQQELFEEFKGPQKRKRFGFKNLAYYPKGKIDISLSYEKATFLLIGLIIVFVIIFTLGVEKGKRFSNQIVTLKQQLQEPQPVKRQQPVMAQPVSAPLVKQTEKPYTIQIASLTRQDFAQQEADRLRRQGYDAFIIKSDKFYLVCVGLFASKLEAQAETAKLKTSYKDCFVKKRR